MLISHTIFMMNLAGEYLWNHTNGSMLTDFFVSEFIGGEQGMASPFVDGFYIDDRWSARGPSEENRSAVSQCGMSAADVAAMTTAWSANMAAAQTAIINAGGFNEQLMLGEYHVHEAARVPPCADFMRDACKPNATIATSAMMFGYTQVSESPHKPFLPNGSLPAFEQDLATFLLVRGPFAWLGYGWLGCGDAAGSCEHGRYVRPPQLELDYGSPVGHCGETLVGTFQREWTKASVQMDCNVGKWGSATITMKSR
jgi:hypothetical protein